MDERVCLCVCVCLSAIMSSELHVRSSPNFLCMLPIYGRGSVPLWWRSDTLCTSGLWMTSCLLISQCHLTSPPSWSAARTRSLGLGYKLCAVIAVAGQRTHGTTFRALKVTSQVATPGAESAVHDCLVSSIIFENEILLIPGCGSSNQLLTNVLSDSSCSGGNCQCNILSL